MTDTAMEQPERLFINLQARVALEHYLRDPLEGMPVVSVDDAMRDYRLAMADLEACRTIARDAWETVEAATQRAETAAKAFCEAERVALARASSVQVAIRATL